jgi:hypothetical protein
MKALITASFLIAMSAVTGHTQVNPQRADLPTQLSAKVADSKASAMSFAQLISITKSSVRENIASSLTKVTDDLIKDQVAGASEVLRAGGTVSFAATVNAKENITEQHSVNVRVSYDARPIGGILNIRVELVPVFGGIGSASRPVISREFAEAVDDFDDDAVSQTIGRLTRELAAEYAAE